MLEQLGALDVCGDFRHRQNEAKLRGSEGFALIVKNFSSLAACSSTVFAHFKIGLLRLELL